MYYDPQTDVDRRREKPASEAAAGFAQPFNNSPPRADLEIDLAFSPQELGAQKSWREQGFLARWQRNCGPDAYQNGHGTPYLR